ncbi:MAG: 4-hydroxy-tetrahydrodipicolinate synthase [Cyclobacteriaceae bacterium]
MKDKFGGTGVALATPMNEDLSVDYNSLEKLINHTIDGGVNYLVVMGTTAESPTFSWREKLEVLSFVIEVNSRRLPVVFGLGGNNTIELIKQSADLANSDIDAILSVCPYYSKPSQEGIKRHYQMLADAFPKPIILYNVPSRTASNVEVQTTLELSDHANIIGMKEASGDLNQCQAIIENKSKDFLLISGDDGSTYDLAKKGAEGVISVIANILPDEFTFMVNSVLNGDLEQGAKLNRSLEKAYELLATEGNPVSLKAGLSIDGLCQDTVRPPLIEGSTALQNAWRAYLSNIRA